MTLIPNLLYTNCISRKGELPLEHYFTNNPDLKSAIREIPYTIKNTNFTFLSDNGVFAKNKIDYASSLLVTLFLENHPELNNAKVLDVGCGYGFIGIVIGKITNASIDLIDINKRALHLCERNLKKNKVVGNVYYSDCYEFVKNKYDYIVTNPPIRAGKSVVEHILLDAKNHLKDNGELWCVIHKDQGAKTTKKALEVCYNVEIVGKSKGFYCFRAKIC